MSSRQITYAALLASFLATTAYVLATVGLLGFFAEMSRSASTVLAMIDLTISLSLILAWMYADSRGTRTPFAPYLLVTLTIGVAGPLMYLLHREARARSRTPVAQSA